MGSPSLLEFASVTKPTFSTRPKMYIPLFSPFQNMQRKLSRSPDSSPAPVVEHNKPKIQENKVGTSRFLRILCICRMKLQNSIFFQDWNFFFRFPRISKSRISHIPQD